MRTMDKQYVAEGERWFSVLLPKIKPLLYQNGGPVIMVQIENEYGFWAPFHEIDCDYAYMPYLRDLFRSYLGNDIILYTTDNWELIG